MEITEIKTRLSLQTVLDHYQIKVDSNGRSLCPWHDDKTPSLQVYLNTNSWTCFSSKCKSGSGDQIDMIRLQEKCTEHEAILKAKVMCGHNIITKHKGEVKTVSESDRINLLSRAFTFFGNAIKQTEAAKKYLESRKLSIGIGVEIGYNGARFHYRGKLTEQEKQHWIDMGLMKAIGDKTSYRSWAKDCLIFPLKNKKDQIVSYYGRSIINEDEQKHYYLKSRSGLYPYYPRPGIKRIILTEAILDAASLIVAGIQTKELGILSCFGTNGLTAEHIQAIGKATDLQEIIFFFDGDQAGLQAIDKYSKQINTRNLIISKINTPEGEDVNSLHVAHEPEIFKHLIENRTVLQLGEGKNIFSFNGKETSEKSNTEIESKLNTNNPDQIIYETEVLQIHIWGGIDKSNLGKLKVSLHVGLKANKYKSFRDEANLYSFAQVKRITNHISEALEISTTYVSHVIGDLTRKLESYRLTLKSNRTDEQKAERVSMTQAEKKAAMGLLKSPKLMRKTLQLIEQSGLVGQQKNGMLLFLLYLSRYFDEPLHAIIFGKSGSGKTYLQTKISDCIPPEDLRVVTSLSENTLYYSPKGFWKHKVLLIEDLEGVYQAFLPLREMMSKQEISKFTTDKDSQGNNVQVLLKVEGPICVSGATTKEWIYEDNANRSYLLIIDESKDHLATVMDYQRKEYAGLIDKSKHEAAKKILQNAQRLLRKVSVINPYAEQLILPDKLFKKLRTNMHYLRLIQIITFYSQYSRPIKKQENGAAYIETNIEDITWANRLIKESLLRKSDELSGKLRQFFEIIKELMRAKPDSEQSFYSKQIRKYLRMNPMTVNRHMRDLEQRGYIKQIGGNRKIGYEYQIELWDDYTELQKGIEMMDANLAKIKEVEEKVKPAFRQEGVTQV